MAQDGKVREQEIADGTRKVFYVDVGDMKPKEALRVINDIRKQQGLGTVTRSWHNWVFIIAAIVVIGIATYTLMPEILTLLPL